MSEINWEEFQKKNELKFLDMVYDYNFAKYKIKSIEEYTELFWSTINNVAIRTLSVFNHTFFRARIVDEDFIVKSKMDIYYPPKEYTKINRLNDKGEQVLYTSDSAICSLSECNIKSGDYFILGAFNCKFQQGVLIGAKTHTSLQTRRTFDPSPNYIASLRNFFLRVITQTVLAGEEYLYNPTIALGKFLSTKDAALYPSVKKYFAMNIAYNKESADKNVQLKFVISAQFIDFEENDDTESINIKHLKIYVLDEKENIKEIIDMEDKCKVLNFQKNTNIFKTNYIDEPSDEHLNPDINKLIDFEKLFNES